MSIDRPADVVTLMWSHRDGTCTTETTDFRTNPETKTTRVWADWDAEALKELADNSIVVPDEVLT